MRIRRAVPLALILALAGAGCDDGDEQAPAPEEEDAPVTAEEIRESGPPSDTGAPAAPEADTASGAPSGPAAPSEGEPAPEARTRTVYTVQVGAFARDRNARTLASRFEDAGLPTWTPAATVDDRSIERVRVGATGSYTEARSLAERLRERFGTEVWIAPVPPDEEIPAGVMESTRTLLEGG